MEHPPVYDRPPLAALSIADLAVLVAELGAPSYRSRQVYAAVNRRAALVPAEVPVLPRGLVVRLAAATGPAATAVAEEQVSADGTTKLLLGLADGRRVETVWIPEGGRRTICVSTQVGCPIGCAFCASGVGGLVRNLAAVEIVEQVLQAIRSRRARPTHLVVMGMGEPLLNLEALAEAVRRWRDPEGLGLSPRRITVSTAATGALVDRLLEEDLGVALAVSLHGPTDETRARLVPTSRPGRVEELVEAATRYARESGRDATVEYVLVAGENDGPADADALVRLLRGRHLHANLIPLNPVGHRPDLAAPSGLEARAFLHRLEAGGLSATLRTRRGADIRAACGQLALERAIGARSPGAPPRG